MGIKAEPEMDRNTRLSFRAHTEEINTAPSQESGMIEEFDDN